MSSGRKVTPAFSARTKVLLAPSIENVRRDREDLRAAKQAHHDFSVRVKADFLRRYPGIDWNAKDVLP